MVRSWRVPNSSLFGAYRSIIVTTALEPVYCRMQREIAVEKLAQKYLYAYCRPVQILIPIDSHRLQCIQIK